MTPLEKSDILRDLKLSNGPAILCFGIIQERGGCPHKDLLISIGGERTVSQLLLPSQRPELDLRTLVVEGENQLSEVVL